jgi:hypothetical protein
MEWVYGNHRNLGWGGALVDIKNNYETIDFYPEFEQKSDVKHFWTNRKHVLRLKNMSLFKYVKLLLTGIKLYNKLGQY